MKNQFTRASVIEEYKKQGNFLEVHWHNPDVEGDNETFQIPLSAFVEFLESKGRLNASFAITINNVMDTIECPMTFEQYWADTPISGKFYDIKDYKLTLSGEDEVEEVEVEVIGDMPPMIMDLQTIFRNHFNHNLPKSA